MSEGLSRRERKKQETRQSMLSAALALFHEKGYDATTVEEITDRADVAKGTFFNYFASKEALLDELALWRVEQLRAVVDVGRGAPASPVARLKVLLGEMQTQVLYDSDLLRRALAMRLYHAPPPLHVGSRLQGLVTELVSEAQARGEVRADVDPELVADLLRVLFVRRLALCHQTEQPLNSADNPERLVDLFLDGLAGPAWRRP